MINSTDKEKRNGQTELNMKEIINMEKKMDSENSYGLICHLIKEISLTIIFMDMVNINGQMVENLLEIGFAIKCMVKVYLLGKTVENIKVIITTIKNRDTGYSHGQMGDNMTVNGIMENKMELVYIIIQDKRYAMDYGKTERE
jgi:hypothetical protein